MRINKFLLIIVPILFFALGPAEADNGLAQKLAGRILLQVESRGEAWYVNPTDFKRYYLGRPQDAFDLMRDSGLGITDNDLKKISVGLLDYDDADSDGDGLSDRFEEALGTDPREADTDGDGYPDRLELENDFDSLGPGRLPIDNNFSLTVAGKILLQTEGRGEAWYVNPADLKRYYLGRPTDAFLVMRELSLGITDKNLETITAAPADPISAPEPAKDAPPACTLCAAPDAGQVLTAAASAIRTGDKTKAAQYFIPGMQNTVDYTIEFLDAEGRLALANIMAGAKESSKTPEKKTFSTEIYFSLGGYKIPVDFNIEKQADGTWLLANL